MERESYRQQLNFNLSGGLLDIELKDKDLDMCLDLAFREIQRYISTTRLATLPFESCIDLTDCGVSTVVQVYRANSNTDNGNSSMSDPMYAAQWQILSGTGMANNLTNWMYNYGSWSTLTQIRNTISTDLAFKYDKQTNRLYINVSQGKPDYITIEYIPLYKDISEITSDYWIDMLMRLAVAYGKIALGRIRTRFSQNNGVWAQDGERILEEGNTELTELRAQLTANNQIFYPID